MISHSIYAYVVFDSSFTTEAWNEEKYEVYIDGIVGQLQDHLPEASFLVFNFREGEEKSEIAKILTKYDIYDRDGLPSGF